MSLTTQLRQSLYSPRAWQPDPYQKKAVKFLLEKAASGLLLDPGLGKTSIVLAALKILKNEGLFERALIVAPLRVCYLVWPLEIEKWLDFNHLRWCILHGNDKDLWLRADADIYLINPEGLDWLLNKDQKVKRKEIVMVEKFGRLIGEEQWVEKTIRVPDTGRDSKMALLNPDVLVIDESTKFRNAQAERCKALHAHLPRFSRRHIMTGTFAPRSLMDLFGQMLIVDQGRALGRFITHYRKRFFVPTGFGGYDYKLQDDGEERIYKTVKPYLLRMDAEDHIKLPELRENNVIVELGARAMKHYTELEDELITQIDDHSVTAASAGVASMKCRQLASGAIYLHGDDDDPVAPGTYKEVHDAKISAIEDLVEERQGRPTLILIQFKHELERLKKVFGKDVAHITGGVSTKRSLEIAKAWNADELPVLIGHPASMGHGLNLQEGSADAMIWMSLPWDLEEYDQTVRRLKRRGSRHSHIIVHHILAADTLDTKVMLQTLRGKYRTQRALYDALKTLRNPKRKKV